MPTGLKERQLWTGPWYANFIRWSDSWTWLLWRLATTTRKLCRQNKGKWVDWRTTYSLLHVKQTEWQNTIQALVSNTPTRPRAKDHPLEPWHWRAWTLNPITIEINRIQYIDIIGISSQMVINHDPRRNRVAPSHSPFEAPLGTVVSLPFPTNVPFTKVPFKDVSARITLGNSAPSS